MANYRGHIGGGVVLGSLYALALSHVPVERMAEAAGVLHDRQALAAILVLSVLFALFPDVDTNSKGQNIFIGMAFAVDVLLIINGSVQAAAYLGLVAMLPILGRHRGWTHSKWAMLAVPLPFIILPYLYHEKLLTITLIYYGAAVVGYFSHLLLDGLIWRHFRVRGF